MKAWVYRTYGGAGVLELVDRPQPRAGRGEVLVKVVLSGVNPTDWKTRGGITTTGPMAFPEMVPNQDGAGLIVDVGDGVDAGRVGERVWLWGCAWQRADGTAQEYLAISSDHAVAMDDSSSFELGASVGVPAMTAHRCLTVGADEDIELAPGSMSSECVLVTGGAGAVGHAAIELARWAGATVATTVSSAEKAELAERAGAHFIVDYRTENVVDKIREFAPSGVDRIVEVNAVDNVATDLKVIATRGIVAAYAGGKQDLVIPIRTAMAKNAHYEFVMIYVTPLVAQRAATKAISAAMAEGALRVGQDAGLPLHHLAFDEAPRAHELSEAGVTGKVLIDVAR